MTTDTFEIKSLYTALAPFRGMLYVGTSTFPKADYGKSYGDVQMALLEGESLLDYPAAGFKWACIYGEQEEARKLIKSGKVDKTLKAGLKLAVANQHPDLIADILETGKIDQKTLDECLILSCVYDIGSGQTTEQFLEACADPLYQNQEAPYKAMLKENEFSLRSCLQSITGVNSSMDLDLIVAAAYNRHEEVGQLVEQDPDFPEIEPLADVHAGNNAALRYASRWAGLESVDILLAAGADTSANDHEAYKWAQEIHEMSWINKGRYKTIMRRLKGEPEPHVAPRVIITKEEDPNKIYGVKNHPKQEEIGEYDFSAPVGEWVGKLDDRAWGKSTNLFCYFIDAATGEKYRLSVFSRQNYQPFQGNVSFREAELGGEYRIETQPNGQGLPKFLKADKI